MGRSGRMMEDIKAETTVVNALIVVAALHSRSCKPLQQLCCCNSEKILKTSSVYNHMKAPANLPVQVESYEFLLLNLCFKIHGHATVMEGSNLDNICVGCHRVWTASSNRNCIVPI